MATTGGCLCGKVRYELDGQPARTVVCHCTHCQRQSGGAFSVNLLARETQLTINGELKTFEDKSESGDVVPRRFCPACGSPILTILASMPGFIAIKAGTLDDRSALKPSLELWRDSKQAWVCLAPEMRGFARNPPAA
jgi:hypothetical protein